MTRADICQLGNIRKWVFTDFLRNYARSKCFYSKYSHSFRYPKIFSHVVEVNRYGVVHSRDVHSCGYVSLNTSSALSSSSPALFDHRLELLEKLVSFPLKQLHMSKFILLESDKIVRQLAGSCANAFFEDDTDCPKGGAVQQGCVSSFENCICQQTGTKVRKDNVLKPLYV